FTGGAMSIYLTGSSSNRFEDWVIDNNTSDGKYYTFYFNYTNDLKLRGNTIDKSSGSGTFYGVYNYYADGKCEIRNNTITKTSGAASGTTYGINQYYAIGTSSASSAMTGNTITLVNATTTYGIYNNYGNY